MRPDLARVVQPLAQLAAAFPANLFFPIAVFLIVHFKLNPDIWLSPLMILGTQWYIVFNVIAGAAAIPSELRDVGANMGLKGWLWLKKSALPAVFPYYLTGAITASGGSLNASIVAEYVSWGDVKLEAKGLGAYIAQATAEGNFSRIVLGIAAMSALVVLLNRLFWRPLYTLAEETLPFRLRGGRNGRSASARGRQRSPGVSGSRRPRARRARRRDMRMNEGQIVGLLGRSGSGKSTLLRLVAGLVAGRAPASVAYLRPADRRAGR